MNYQEFIAKALRGRSVAALAKQLNVTQMTLNRYVRGDRLPDYDTALMLANEAGVSPGETMMILAAEQRSRKDSKEILAPVFHRLTNAVNCLLARVSAA